MLFCANPPAQPACRCVCWLCVVWLCHAGVADLLTASAAVNARQAAVTVVVPAAALTAVNALLTSLQTAVHQQYPNTSDFTFGPVSAAMAAARLLLAVRCTPQQPRRWRRQRDVVCHVRREGCSICRGCTAKVCPLRRASSVSYDAIL